MPNVSYVEQEILHEICKRYTLPDRIDEMVQNIKHDISAGFKEYYDTLNEFSKQKNSRMYRSKDYLML